MTAKRKHPKQLFATIVNSFAGRMRSSFFDNEADAIAYAERMAGVIEVEEIGGGTVWRREPAQ